MNKLIILGNLTRDPESGTSPTGVAFCNFTVAVNRYSNGKETTDFVRVTAWRNRAEACMKYLKKGSKVLAMGPVTAHAWTAQDGAARASMDMSADEVEFFGAGQRGDQDQQPAQNATQTTPAEPQPVAVGDDELPF